MDRKRIIAVHVWLASLFFPAVLLMAITGGLYLLGVKGTVTTTPVAALENASVDSSTTKADLEQLLAAAGINHDFEYVKVSGDQLITRPTSKVYYVFENRGDTVQITRHDPSLQSRMMELHKGHGPTMFKNFQKLLALGLVINRCQRLPARRDDRATEENDADHQRSGCVAVRDSGTVDVRTLPPTASS